jgi:hypothetical protein
MNLENSVYIFPERLSTSNQLTYLAGSFNDKETESLAPIPGRLKSVKAAAKTVLNIIDNSNKEVIIETGCRDGRLLWHEIIQSPSSDSSRLFEIKDKMASQIKLCSLYDTLKPHFEQIGTKGFQKLCLEGLGSARSIGGVRDVSDNEAVSTIIAFCTKPEQINYECGPYVIRIIYYHPLSLFPRFFVAETTRLLGKYINHDAKRTESLILELTACLCRLRQSPFPLSSGKECLFSQLFPPNCSLTLQDTIYSVLSNNKSVRESFLKHYPEQGRIVLLSDQLLDRLHGKVSGVFAGRVNDTYNLIRSFLDLVLGCWVESFYTKKDKHIKSESMIDYSVLREPSRKRFIALIKEMCSKEDGEEIYVEANDQPRQAE